MTAYEIEWDPKPHTPEVQTIKTEVNTGPNEVVIFTTSATHVDEVQFIRTTASDVNEVQQIKLTNVASGYYTVKFDTTATGGSLQESGPIMFDAPAAATGSRNSVEEILESMSNIGQVTVTREGSSGSYWYNVTFTTDDQDLPQLALGTSQLTGAGANVEFKTWQDGNHLGGSFT